MPPHDKPPLLLIARSARYLAQAASAHWSPCVIDGFADADTRTYASAWRCLELDEEWSFDPTQLFDAIAELTAREAQMPIVVGAGLEACGSLLQRVAREYRLASAPPRVFARLLALPQLFDELARLHGVNVPQTRRLRPPSPHGWLRKQAGACGGTHVRWLCGADALEDTSAIYYQRFVPGESISGLYLAHAEACQLIQLQRHLAVQASVRDFSYQGAVTWHDAPRTLAAAATELGARVAAVLGIRGLFGLDFIRASDAELVLVDINPRPPATLDLASDSAALIDAHVAACTSEPLLYSKRAPVAECGHLIVYAGARCTVPSDCEWPPGTADRPLAGEVITAGAPLCTLTARGASAGAVLAGLTSAYRELHASLGHGAVSAHEITITPVGGNHHV